MNLFLLIYDNYTNFWFKKILEALWDLKDRSGLSRDLLLIYSEHLSVLSAGNIPRDQAKSLYLKKCCDEIKAKPGSSIAIASLRHVYDILNSYHKSSNKSLKDVLNNQVLPMIKVCINSLHECQNNAINKASTLNALFDQNLLVDDIFTHEQVVCNTLDLIRFILQEGNVYLNVARAKEIWDILISNENACEWDRDVGFGWFLNCVNDLDENTKIEIFNTKILALDSCKLTSIKGYECFKLYFIKVNGIENKLHSTSHNDIDNFVVDELNLTGLSFLWDLITRCKSETIANMAIKFLLDLSYEKVSIRLRKEIVQLHQSFINECYSRLENCFITLDQTSAVSQLMLNTVQLAAAPVKMTEINDVIRSTQIETRQLKYKYIERVLMVAEMYILAVEENIHSTSRINKPHFLTFKAETFPLNVVLEEKNISFEIFACANETLGDLRKRIIDQIQKRNASISNYNNAVNSYGNNNNNSSFFSNSNYYQIYLHNDRILSQSNDYKLLTNLGKLFL
jgi:hypothetical protein